MPFPLDPTFQSTGKPFLTVPDGTTAPDNAGDPVDLTGTPITVAPETNAVQSGDSATISAFGANLLTLTGLTNMVAPDSVGRLLTLAGSNPGNRGTFPIAAVLSKTSVQVTDAAGVFPDQNSGAAATISAFAANLVTLTGLTGLQSTDVGRTITVGGAANLGNDGTFDIVEVLDPTSAVVANPAGVFPDANSGALTWSEDIIPSAWSEAVDPNAFAPGDPLTYLADQVAPFIFDQKTFGPAHGGGAAILPPNIDVPVPTVESERTGKNDPHAPAVGTVGPVVFTDPQQPVRFQPTAQLRVNRDINSLAFGQAPVMQDGPRVAPPSVVVEVPEPGAEPAKPVGSKGGLIYGDINKVIFS